MEPRTRTNNPTTGLTRTNVRRREVEHAGTTWLDLAVPTASEIGALRERFGYDPLILDLLTSDARRPRCDVYPQKDYLFVELHIPGFDRDENVVTNRVALFVGRAVVVSIHDGSIKSLRRMFAAAATDEAARAQLLGRGSGYLAFRIIDAAVKSGFQVVFQLEVTTRQLEGRLFGPTQRFVVRDLAHTRRELVAVRAMLGPSRAALARLVAAETPFLMIDNGRYFGDCRQNGEKLYDLATEQAEAVEGYFAALEAHIAQRQSQTLSLIALLLILLVPLALLGALAGLNSALPVTEQPVAFTAVVLLAIAVAVGILAFVRYRNLL
jgi:magnesium transporter